MTAAVVGVVRGDAAAARLAMAASRDGSEGRAGRLAAPYSPECVEGVFCELRLYGFYEVRLKVFSEVRAVMLTSMHRPTGIAWLVAPGLAMIAITYGLARFAYGLFLPEMRESLDLSESVLGLIGAGSYAGYCFAVVGMATVAGAPTAWVLALGVLVAGSSSGLASPPMGEAVATAIPEESQD